MRVYYIKDYYDGVCLNKKGSNSTLWDATYVLENGYAVPWDSKHLHYEPQAEQTPEEESGTKKERATGKAKKKEIRN